MNDKIYATPIAVQGSQILLELLIHNLTLIGYKIGAGWEGNHNLNSILTSPENSFISTSIEPASRWKYVNGLANSPRQVITIEDQIDVELCMVLAAMRVSRKFHPWELVVPLKESGPYDASYHTHRLYKIVEVSEFNLSTTCYDCTQPENAWGNQNFRKATVQEIYQHYTEKKMNFKSVNQQRQELGLPPFEREKGNIIGYKFKEGVDPSFFEKISFRGTANRKVEEAGCWMSYDCGAKKAFQQSGTLHLLFDEVYEPEFKEEDWIFIEHAGLGAFAADNNVGQIISPLVKINNGCTDGNIKVKIGTELWGLNDRDPKFKIRKATQEEIDQANVKVITLTSDQGSFELEVSKKGIYYRPEDTWLSYTDIKSVLAAVNNFRNNQGKKNVWTSRLPDGNFHRDKSYTFTAAVTHIDMGCKKGVPIQDLEKVFEALKQQFK